MPTILLASWPILSFIAFINARPATTLLLAVFIPFLFLPEALLVRLPGVPDLDKVSVITVGLMLLVFLQAKKFRSIKPATGFSKEGKFLAFLIVLLFMVMIAGTYMTMLANREPLLFTVEFALPGMTNSDVITRVSAIVFMAFPFYVGQRYFGTQEGQQRILYFIAVSCLCYTALMLIELRFSPQLHRWVYGYHQHSFVQHVRDGFRPKVFLEHGLVVGLFLFMSVLSAVALWRIKKDKKWLFAAIWLFVMLVLSRNLGATAITLLIVPIFLFTTRWVQLVFMLCLSAIIVTYPVVRGTKIVPINSIVDAAATISQERAASLEYRLRNEELVLERNRLKPITGWGNWSRGRVHDENGNDLTVVEGWWIQAVMEWGWIGYVSLFGIVVSPVFMLFFIRKRRKIPTETIAVGLILCGNFIDFIPNSAFPPVSWLLLGSLAGYIFRTGTVPEEVKKSNEQMTGVVSYSRFPKSDPVHA